MIYQREDLSEEEPLQKMPQGQETDMRTTFFKDETGKPIFNKNDSAATIGFLNG